MRIAFYYDVVCPYARIGYHRLLRLAAATGAEVELRPILLGGIFQEVGTAAVPAAAWGPAKFAHGERDIALQTARADLPFCRPASHPQRTVSAMRLLTLAEGATRAALTHALFEAYWAEGAELTAELIAGLARAHGIDPERLTEESTKRALRENTAAAAAAGVIGVPAFGLGDRLWWGQDRLHLLEAALLGRRVEPMVRLSNRTGRRLRVFHDFSSPFSYIASTQVEAIARRHGSEVEWVPMLLGAVFKAVGTPEVPLFTLPEAKQAWVARDLGEQADWWGIDFSFPAHFPLRSVLPLRVSILEPRAIHPMYRAYWAQGRDIGDPAVLAEVLTEGGLDPALVQRANEPAVKDRLRANTEAAVAAGVFGAPSFIVDDEPVVWGQDRLSLLEDILAGWSPAIATPAPPRAAG
jgi:2-hydroxychromene-2-carboxylate isomerase